ncbi:MAG TPA: ATP-binding cassette domain-containing protein [Anaerolineae bacterium]|nr:ATP-binding cassette domain-containing protein [Anaerolineae bacterium]
MTTRNGQENPVVKMENITMRFGRVTALEDVDFEVRRPEVMALLGDNGAGKSTLIKILTGVHTPTNGQIYIEGQPVHIRTPHDARVLGIETAYQDLALVNSMSIGRNFFLGREPTRPIGPFRWLDVRRMVKETGRALADIGINVRSANEKVGKLSGGERQSIAIGRAVHFGVKLLILDEPTSALSVAESRKVLEYTLNAKERGLSVIFITHNVHHVMQVADRYTIIRHGKNVGTYNRADLSEGDISDLITGERES